MEHLKNEPAIGRFDSMKRVTPLSKYLAMILFIVVPFIGGWIGYRYAPEKIVEVEKMVPKEIPATTVPGVYVDDQLGFQFEYPDTAMVKSVEVREVVTQGEPVKIPLPQGSVEVMGLIVSPVSYEQFSEANSIYDYDSCCSGTRYWFDGEKNEWHANLIQVGRYDDSGSPIPDPNNPLMLMENGVCSLEEVFGSNTFYKVESGDEGVPTDIHYFLLTNRGDALRFTIPYDVRKDYSSYADSAQPSSELLQSFKNILSSVKMLEGTSAVKANCV